MTQEQVFELSRALGSKIEPSDEIKEQRDILLGHITSTIEGKILEMLSNDDLRAIAHTIVCKYTGDNPGIYDSNRIGNLGWRLVEWLSQYEQPQLDQLRDKS